MELPPLLVGTGLCKQELDRVARVVPWGGRWRAEEMSRLAGGGLHRRALQPGLEVWPVFLQFLIVSGNCKELQERKEGCTECPRPPFAGVGGTSWDQEMSGRRCNPEATGSYLVLVIGAQAVPGLRVVLSVPAVEREGEG